MSMNHMSDQFKDQMKLFQSSTLSDSKNSIIQTEFDLLDLLLQSHYSMKFAIY